MKQRVYVPDMVTGCTLYINIIPNFPSLPINAPNNVIHTREVFTSGGGTDIGSNMVSILHYIMLYTIIESGQKYFNILIF